jgi:hypothetical protein
MAPLFNLRTGLDAILRLATFHKVSLYIMTKRASAQFVIVYTWLLSAGFEFGHPQGTNMVRLL